jgi:hypothetical protein
MNYIIKGFYYEKVIFTLSDRFCVTLRKLRGRDIQSQMYDVSCKYGNDEKEQYESTTDADGFKTPEDEAQIP